MTSSENLVTQKEISTLGCQMPTVSHKDFPSSEHIEDLSATNFQFKNFEFENENHIPLKFITEKNVVLMQFCFQGECVYKSSNGKKSAAFKNSEYNILYIPKGDFNFTARSKELSLLNIYIEEEFFLRQIPSEHIIFKHKKKNTFGAVLSKNHYINPKIKSILNEINTCEFDGHLKMLYLKAKVIELLTLQLAQAEEETGIELKLDEIEKMMKVKELIENNLSEFYSLAYLAKTAGTNEQYLKKHFKILHGHTVFGYILTCKMQKAKEMLLTGNYRITEIAEIVGYKHATHFTSAFKKFFGYLPRAIKTKFFLSSYFMLDMEYELLELILLF